ncbi:MAG: DnaD domain protein [Lachnospiraceae bacterium]|nr:DnaD domain protein [Lachnospiraceae bacterium]
MREVRAMAGLSVKNRRRCSVTLVSNRFIDQFLPEANGEFVKVYLLLLRQVSGGGELSVSRMADGLDNTEKDVLRALKYWEKMKLLKLEYGEDRTLSGIVLLEEETSERGDLMQEESQEKVSLSDVQEATDRTELSAEESDRPEISGPEANREENPLEKNQPLKRTVDLQALNEDEDFCQLLYLAGRYTAKNLTPRDCDILANLYAGEGMSAELLEYLVEYCVSNGHKSMRYIETVALNWKERGIRTVEEARAGMVNGGKNTYAVLKAFGLGGRNPAAVERSMIDRWFRDYGFSVEMVLEACDRTMRAIHQPSFEYADKILKEWKARGIQKKDDIARLDGRPGAWPEGKKKETDKTEAGRTEVGKRGTGKREGKKPNRFHNFPQRDYDYDALVKELNGF